VLNGQPTPAGWQPDHEHYCLGISGISGCGKTTGISRFLLSPRTKAPLKFVFDPRGTLIQRLGKPAAHTPEALMQQLPGGWVCFHPFPMFRDLEKAANWFSGWIMTVCEQLPGRKVVAFDELQNYAEGNRPPENVLDVFNTGRNFGIDTAYVCLSFGEVSRQIVKQTDEVVALHNACSSNAWWLQKWGMDAAAVARLPKGYFLSLDRMRNVRASGRLF
jgi:hypothetical protein